jgi:hypothetical protein
MEEISRSVRQAKQAKIWDADCTCPYSPYGHVEGRTIMMMWQLMRWQFVGLIVGNQMLTRVRLRRIIRGHVAQSMGATCPPFCSLVM